METLQLYLVFTAVAGVMKHKGRLTGRKGFIAAALISIGSATLAIAVNFWQNAERIAQMPVLQAAGLFTASVLILASCLAVPLTILLRNLPTQKKLIKR